MERMLSFETRSENKTVLQNGMFAKKIGLSAQKRQTPDFFSQNAVYRTKSVIALSLMLVTLRSNRAPDSASCNLITEPSFTKYE